MRQKDGARSGEIGEPTLAPFREDTGTRQPLERDRLTDVVELSAGKYWAIEWYFHGRCCSWLEFCAEPLRAVLVLFQSRETEPGPTKPVSSIQHVPLAVVIENERIFDHLGVPTGIRDIQIRLRGATP
jgi:hypothetical protein